MASSDGWEDVPVDAPGWETAPLQPPRAQPVPEAGPSELKSLGRGAWQGATFGFGDERAGFVDALAGQGRRLLGRVKEGRVFASPMEEVPALLADYRTGRDERRATNDAARAANPKSFLVGEVAGGMVVPGGGAAKSGARVLRAALQGTAAGIGTSDADLTQGDAGGALVDAGIGTVLGGLAGTAGEGLRAGATRLSGMAGERLSAASTKAKEMAQKVLDEEMRSLRGKAGAAVAAANRTLENLERMMTDPAVDGAKQAAAREFLESAEGVALRRGVLDSTLAMAPGRLGEVDTATTALRTAREGYGTALEEGTANLLSPATAVEQVRARAQRYLPPLLGDMVGRGSLPGAAAGAGLGMAMGGDWQDAGLGALAGAGLRPGIHAVRRMVQHPSVQTALWGAANGVASSPLPGALAHEAGALARSETVQSPLQTDAEVRMEALVRALRRSRQDDSDARP